MRDREAILGPLGYDVRYRTQSNYNGSRGGDREVCIARKGDSEFFAHVFNDPVKLDRHRRIQTVQDSIPNMARIELIVGRVVLFAKAEGKLLWDYDPPPEIRAVESQLLDFAAATQMNGLIHGDLRPWNVFVDDEKRLTVIDWGLASFVDELSTYDLFREGHLRLTHADLDASKFSEIDAIDAVHVVEMIKGNTSYTAAWGPGPPNDGPSWFRR